VPKIIDTNSDTLLAENTGYLIRKSKISQYESTQEGKAITPPPTKPPPPPLPANLSQDDVYIFKISLGNRKNISIVSQERNGEELWVQYNYQLSALDKHIEVNGFGRLVGPEKNKWWCIENKENIAEVIYSLKK
jgi:hypothetical protein